MKSIQICDNNNYQIYKKTYFKVNENTQFLPIYLRIVEVLNTAYQITLKTNKTSLFNSEYSNTLTYNTYLCVNFSLQKFFPDFELTNNQLVTQIFKNCSFNSLKIVEDINNNLNIKKQVRKNIINALKALKHEKLQEFNSNYNLVLNEIILNNDQPNNFSLTQKTLTTLNDLIELKTNDILVWFLKVEETLVKEIITQDLIVNRSIQNLKFDKLFDLNIIENQNCLTKYKIQQNIIVSSDDISQIPITYNKSSMLTFFKLTSNCDELLTLVTKNYLSWLLKMNAIDILRIKHQLIYSPVVKVNLGNLIYLENTFETTKIQDYIKALQEMLHVFNVELNQETFLAYKKIFIGEIEELISNKDFISFYLLTNSEEITIEAMKKVINKISNLQFCEIPKPKFVKNVLLKGR